MICDTTIISLRQIQSMKQTDKKDNGFKAFWDAYGLKRDRAGAERAWNRLSAGDRRAALAGIAAYRDDCSRRGVSMAYGVRYLTHRRWEDEYDDAPAPAQAPAAAPPENGQEMEIW